MNLGISVPILAATLAVSGPAASRPPLVTAAPVHGAVAFFFDSRSRDGNSRTIDVVNADGSGRRTLAGPYALMGAISPDGRRIVYWTSSPQAARLVVASVTGQHARTVHVGSPYAYQPDWSPAMQQLAFGRGPGGPGTGLFVSDVSGRHVRPVPGTREGTAPRYFPDGKRVVYMRGLNPCCQLFQIGIDGRGKRRVGGQGLGAFPDVSPDGRTILFQRDKHTADPRLSRNQLLVQSSSGGPVRVVPNTGSCVNSPRWSPDGAVIFFVSCSRDQQGKLRFGHDRIAEIAPDGSGLRYLVSRLGLVSDLRPFAVRPAAPSSPPAAGTPTPAASGDRSPAPASRPGRPSASRARSRHEDRLVPIVSAAGLLMLTALALLYARRRRPAGPPGPS